MNFDKIAEKSRTFLVKLQNLPENKKIIILWTIVVILGAGMGYFWVNSAIKSFPKLGEAAGSVISSINIPSSDMPSMPSLDILQTSPTKILPEQNLGGQATPSK